LVGKGSVGPQVGGGLYVDDGGAVYGSAGHFSNSWLSKLRSGTLELLEQTGVLGRYARITKQCGHLIVAGDNYGDRDAGITKLSLDDLSVKGKIVLSVDDPLAGVDCIAPLQEPYVAIAGFDRISVYDVDDMRLVDTITTPKELNISWGHRELTVIYRPLSAIQEN
jgi:hypothetical protein